MEELQGLEETKCLEEVEALEEMKCLEELEALMEMECLEAMEDCMEMECLETGLMELECSAKLDPGRLCTGIALDGGRAT